MEEFNRRWPTRFNASIAWPPVGRDPRHAPNRDLRFRQPGPEAIIVSPPVYPNPLEGGVLDGWADVTAAYSFSRALHDDYLGSFYTDAGGGAISALLNQAGTANLSQGTAANRPTIGTGGDNAVACGVFDGIDNYLVTGVGGTINDLMSASDGYLCVAFMTQTFKADDQFYDINGVLVDNDGYIGIGCGDLSTPGSGSDAVGFGVYDATNGDVNNNIPAIINRIYVAELWIVGGETLYSRLNGGAEFSNATFTGGMEFATGNLQMGSSYNLTDWFTGKIFEAVVASTVPSLAQRDALVANMLAHIGQLTDIVVEDITKVNDTGTDLTITFTYPHFGPAVAGRKLLVGASAMDAASAFTINSAVLAGVGAKVTVIDSNQTLAALISADEATLANGTCVATASEAITNDQMGALVAAYGLAAGAPAASGTNVVASGTQIQLTLANAGFTAGMAVFIAAAKRASATAFDGISDDGNSTNPWVEIENIAPPDGGARLGMWYKIFETSEVGTDVIVTITGGAVSTEFAAVYNRFAPA